MSSSISRTLYWDLLKKIRVSLFPLIGHQEGLILVVLGWDLPEEKVLVSRKAFCPNCVFRIFQLRRVFGSCLPPFPPKYYLAMTTSMADQRRDQLEQYLQNGIYIWVSFYIFIEIYAIHCKIHPFKVNNSMVFNIFTELCNHFHDLWEQFHHPKNKPHTYRSATPCSSPPPAPITQYTNFCLYRFACF